MAIPITLEFRLNEMLLCLFSSWTFRSFNWFLRHSEKGEGGRGVHFFEKLFGRLRTVWRRNLAFQNKLRQGTKHLYFLYIFIYIYFLAATIVSHSKQRLTACLIFMLSYHCVYRQFLQDRWYNFLSLINISNSRSNVLKLTNENNNGSITCLSMLSANATNADGLRYWGSLGHTDSESDTVTQTGDLDVHSRLLFARLQPPEILHTYAMIQPYNSDPHKRGV